MVKEKKKGLKWIVAALVLGVAAILAWQRYGAKEDDRLASGNGRIEAAEIDVAAKIAGRIKKILVREGDFVTAGQVVALMDTEVLAAQLREAKAQLQHTQSTAATARSQLVQREAEKAASLGRKPSPFYRCSVGFEQLGGPGRGVLVLVRLKKRLSVRPLALGESRVLEGHLGSLGISRGGSIYTVAIKIVPL